MLQSERWSPDNVLSLYVAADHQSSFKVVLHSTLEIKPITTWLVCCRVVHGHGMLRLGIQGLALQGNCWFVIILGSEFNGKWKFRIAWIGIVVYGKCFGVGKITGVIETWYLSYLVRESECMPQGGMEGVCRVAISCVQLNGCKITSANPNEDWFTEWRWLVLEWGFSSTFRSL